MNFDEILDEVEQLELDEQRMLIDILKNRLAGKGRLDIISDVVKGREDYAKGNVSRGNVDDLMSELD